MATGDELPSPSGASDHSGIANAIDAGSVAVGRFKTALKPKLAAYWVARSGISANQQGINLGSWYPPDDPPKPGSDTSDALSEATGIANVGGTEWIVGWSGSSEVAPSATNPSIKATLKKGSSGTWRDLNDRHFVHGLTGWSLKRAAAVNASGYIVGNGLLNGNPRGFILVPRSAGQ